VKLTSHYIHHPSLSANTVNTIYLSPASLPVVSLNSDFCTLFKTA
jgi:hypothetical protein